MSETQGQKSPNPVRQPRAERHLALDCNGHRYTFRYRCGEERQVLQALVAMAEDPASKIDWYDAAMLSHGVGVSLGEMLEELLKH